MLQKSLLGRATLISGVGIASLLLSTLAAESTTRALTPPPAAHPITRSATTRAGVKTDATTTLIGGGATLPAIAYVGATQATTVNPATSPATGTVFAFVLANNKSDAISYCQTGSGFGKKVLDGTVAANNACAALGATATGFGAPATQAFADFSGSDAPVASSEYSTFATNAGNSSSPIFGRGEFVQDPYIAGAVALFYNNSSVTSQLSLSVFTLCEIADGQITNWNQIPVNPADPTGTKFARKTLKWVYRSDSSGTTFSFSNFLSSTTSTGTPHACSHTGQTYGLNMVFDPSNTTVSPAPSTGVLPSPLPSGASNANFLGGNGNAGVAACIVGSAKCTKPSGGGTATGGDGSIGYVEAANALNDVSGVTLDFATLLITSGSTSTTVDPIKDLPAAAGLVKTTTTDKVVNASVENGRPSPELSAVTATTKTGCLILVDPASYEFPTSGYPIIAVTNLEFASAGNGAKAAVLQSLANITHIGTNFATGKITSVDPFGTSSAPVTGKTGYAEIAIPSPATTLKGCIGT